MEFRQIVSRAPWSRARYIDPLANGFSGIPWYDYAVFQESYDLCFFSQVPNARKHGNLAGVTSGVSELSLPFKSTLVAL